MIEIVKMNQLMESFAFNYYNFNHLISLVRMHEEGFSKRRFPQINIADPAGHTSDINTEYEQATAFC